ncbi:MAG: MobF family relaxase, partial [Propionicimonas sp.]|nr:MobF family relaxase [Propionicimonas sp.]
GEHPLSTERRAALGPGVTATEKRDAVRIGRPFRQPDTAISAFQEALNQHFVAWNLAHGNPAHASVSADVRASIRTKLATAWFTEIEGRPPNARELAGFLAKATRPPAKVVAGFDATFSPMKSVSALWALVDRDTAALIEQAHNLAVGDALRFLESKKTFTRRGRAGAQQVETRGLIATVFTHRDTRVGDPDLHTHVVIANKVQAASDGEWLALDGRPLHKAITAASETYNTALQAHLTERLGVVWRDVPRTDGRQPVREIVGVDSRLTKAWSKRRADITERAGELAMAFQHNHGRPPTPAEQQDLYQQATLETREAKHEPRSRNEQRAAWRAEADRVLGQGGVDAMLATVFSQIAASAPTLDSPWFTRTAELVIAGVEERRGQWQEVHIRAEAQRQVRTAGVRAADLETAVEQLIARVVGRSVLLTPTGDAIEEPAGMRRMDGTSVYRVAGSDWYTSERMLLAERRIIDAAGRTGGRRADTNSVETMLLAARASDTPLNPSQAAMVVAMATSGRRVQLALAPAGSGKTTAMHALKTAWVNSGGDVVGLAPSATAARQLGQALGVGVPTDTLHKLAHDSQGASWAGRITHKTLVIIDEAGMADTLVLDQVISFALDRGASVRLVGDDQQLGAIASGG